MDIWTHGHLDTWTFQAGVIPSYPVIYPNLSMFCPELSCAYPKWYPELSWCCAILRYSNPSSVILKLIPILICVIPSFLELSLLSKARLCQGTTLGLLLFLVQINNVGFDNQLNNAGELLTSTRNIKEANNIHLKFVDDMTYQYKGSYINRMLKYAFECNHGVKLIKSKWYIIFNNARMKVYGKIIYLSRKMGRIMYLWRKRPLLIQDLQNLGSISYHTLKTIC